MNTKGINIVLVLWMELALCNAKDIDYGPECKYDGDLCTDDFVNCIKKMENAKDVRSCGPGILYGPRKILDSRNNIDFWITMDDSVTSKYRTDLQYAILRMSDWNKYESLSPISGCCSLKLNDTCTLPKRETENEIEKIYIPLAKNNSSKRVYCKMDIEEKAGAFEYCTDEQDTVCLEFRDGVLHIRNVFYPLSVQNYMPRAEYCFFPTPIEYLMTNGNESGYKIFRPRISVTYSIPDANNTVVTFGEIEDNCDIVKAEKRENVIQLADEYGRSTRSSFVCFFSRVTEWNVNWLEDLSCVKLSTDKNDVPGDPTVHIIVAAACVIGFVTVLVVFFAWVHKKYIIKLTFKKNIEQLPAPLVGRKYEGNIPVYLGNDGDFKSSVLPKETVEKINISRAQEEILPIREEVNNNRKQHNSLDTRVQPNSCDPRPTADDGIEIPDRSKRCDSGFGSDKDAQEGDQTEITKSADEDEKPIELVDAISQFVKPLPTAQLSHTAGQTTTKSAWENEGSIGNTIMIKDKMFENVTYNWSEGENETEAYVSKSLLDLPSYVAQSSCNHAVPAVVLPLQKEYVSKEKLMHISAGLKNKF